MKNSLFLLIILSSFFFGCATQEQAIKISEENKNLAQSLDQLHNEVADLQISQDKTLQALQNIIKSQNQIIDRMNNASNAKINPVLMPDSINKSQLNAEKQGNGRCQALTKSGKQCSRNASAGSDYCWQHQNQVETNVKKSENSSTEYFTGPRGGTYHYSKSGKKVYGKRK